MKHSLAVTLAIAVALGSTTASARPRPRRGKAFVANKTFGLGLMLGEPTGLTGKYFLTESTALDFGIGDYDHYRDRTGLDVHVDYLIHPVDLLTTEPFELPLYVGLGGRMLDFRQNADDVHAIGFGIRAPIGVSMDFNNVPLDIFFEAALVLDFFYDYTDDAGFDLDFAIGIRYWFN